MFKKNMNSFYLFAWSMDGTLLINQIDMAIFVRRLPISKVFYGDYNPFKCEHCHTQQQKKNRDEKLWFHWNRVKIIFKLPLPVSLSLHRHDVPVSNVVKPTERMDADENDYNQKVVWKTTNKSVPTTKSNGINGAIQFPF